MASEADANLMTSDSAGGADIIGGFAHVSPNCAACGEPLTVENAWMTDGCPCNSHLGVNNANETRWRLLMELQQRQSREVERLKQRLLTAAGDDLCRLSQEEIKAMSAGAVQIPPKSEFLASCERFHAQVAGEAGVNARCLTLAQLIAENERQASELARAEQTIISARYWVSGYTNDGDSATHAKRMLDNYKTLVIDARK